MSKLSTDHQPILKTDKPVFIAGAILSLIPVVMFLVLGEAGNDAINSINLFLTREFNWIYAIEGLVFIIFPVAVACSKLGKLKLGGADATPEFGFFKWGAIMFSSGISASIFWAGSSEWVYYMQTPPPGVEPGSPASMEIAQALSVLHWGPMIWGAYLISAIIVGYLFQIKRQPALKVSVATSLAYKGKPYENKLNRVIDTLMIGCLVLSAATSLGLTTPYASAAVATVFGIPNSKGLQLLIMGIVVVVFTISSTAGMKKGQAFISDLNMKVAICLIAFVAIVGPTKMILEEIITSMGIFGDNFLSWSTNLNPFDNTNNFNSDWTSFYWVWVSSSAPVLGAYYARISKGRTLRQMIIGVFAYGTIACSAVVWVISTFSIDLTMRGVFDVPAQFASSSDLNMTVMQMFKENIPGSTIFLALLAFSCIIFLATTFDGFSFSLGSFCTQEITPEQEPSKPQKLFWSLMIAAIPLMVILFNGNLKTVQSTAVIAGTITMVFLYLMIYGFIKTVKQDRVYIARRLKEQDDLERAAIEAELGESLYAGSSADLNPFEQD